MAFKNWLDSDQITEYSSKKKNSFLLFITLLFIFLSVVILGMAAFNSFARSRYHNIQEQLILVRQSMEDREIQILENIISSTASSRAVSPSSSAQTASRVIRKELVYCSDIRIKENMEKKTLPVLEQIIGQDTSQGLLPSNIRFDRETLTLIRPRIDRMLTMHTEWIRSINSTLLLLKVQSSTLLKINRMAITLWITIFLLYFTFLIGFSWLAMRSSRNEAEMHLLKMNSLMNTLRTRNEELRKEAESHRETQSELHEYKDHLQSLVDKQTHQLLKSNRNLEKSMKDLKETQQQLVISEKLASLGSLVAGVSHEINTPIGSSLTGVTFIQDRAKDLLKEYQSGNLSEEDLLEFLDSVSEISQSILLSLRDAINLIQSLKRVSTDQASNCQREFNLKDYLQEIILSLKNILKKTEIVIDIDCPAQITLFSYPGFFSQIISNLVQNSLIHGYPKEKKGHLTIQVEEMIQKEITSLKIRYQDDGSGIRDEIKNKVFDPFFTTARGKGGTGLGLSIVWSLVTENLAGSIKTYTPPQGGAGFEIILPLHDHKTGEITD